MRGQKLRETACFNTLQNRRLLLEGACMRDVVLGERVTTNGCAALGLGFLGLGCGHGDVLTAAIGIAEHELTQQWLLGHIETSRATALLEGISHYGCTIRKREVEYRGNSVVTRLYIRNAEACASSVYHLMCAESAVRVAIDHSIGDDAHGITAHLSETCKVR